MIPAMWMQPDAVPRPQLRPGVGALRGAADAGRHPLRLGRSRRVRRPPRHLRHRGHVVAGAPDVVPALVGRVRPLPRAALRRHRGRLLVDARPAVVRGTACCLGASRARRSWRTSPFADALGDLLPSEYVDRNCFIGLANTKRRELGMRYEIGIDNMLWGTDFPHPEGTWPNTQRLAEEDLLRHPDRRDPAHARPRRRRDLRLRHRRRCAQLAEKIGPTPTDLGQLDDDPDRRRPRRQVGGASRTVGRHWLTGHDFPLMPGEPNRHV